MVASICRRVTDRRPGRYNKPLSPATSLVAARTSTRPDASIVKSRRSPGTTPSAWRTWRGRVIRPLLKSVAVGMDSLPEATPLQLESEAFKVKGLPLRDVGR